MYITMNFTWTIVKKSSRGPPRSVEDVSYMYILPT